MMPQCADQIRAAVSVLENAAYPDDNGNLKIAKADVDIGQKQPTAPQFDISL